jgi:polysaccharide biosynthesis protein PelG
MAGIGFELKKLFKSAGLLGRFRAFAYSALVSLGPFILCTIIIAAILLLMGFMDISYKDRELFIATIVYCFIFSQIIASGFKMIISRFIADMIFTEKYDMILPSLFGLLGFAIPISGAAGLIFLFNSPLPFLLKLVSYLLFMELIIVFIMMEYLSAVKDYMKIVKSFLAGIALIIALSFVFIKYTNIETVLAMLLALVAGFTLIIAYLFAYLIKFYGRSSGRYFNFLEYFDKYPSLFFVGIFYTLGLYIHNFIFWTSELGVKIGQTYVYAPVYDVPTFYAFLSIMPSMVMFVVSVETSFYDKYKAYYALITGKGNFKDIESARKEMTRVLWSEIRNIMELQLFFTLVFIAAGSYILPRLGLTQLSVDIFNLLALGGFMAIVMMIIMLLLLYFEDRKGAVFVATTFLASNIVFTWFTMSYSESVYGLGFFAASLLSLAVALIEMLVFLKNINYHTFCGQPVIFRQKTGMFGKLILAFTPKKERPAVKEV